MTRAMSPRPAVFLTLLALAALPGCAASLRADLDARPNGAFAQGAVTRAAALTPPAPAADGASTALGQTTPKLGQTAAALAGAPAKAPAARRGPVAAADLAAIGITAEDDRLAAFRGDWRPDARTLAYSDARAAFLARSPAVAAAIQGYRAAFERYGQVGALNDLVRQCDAFGGELTKTGATTPRLRQHLAKGFPFGGVSSLQGELVTVDVTLARIQLERQVLGALADFEAAWQGAYYWQRATGILGSVTALATRVVDAAHARYRAGRTGHANLIQAEIRQEDLTVQLATARARRSAARLALAAALDLPSEVLAHTALKLDAHLPKRPDRAATRAAAAAHGPAVASARAKRERADLLVQLAERQLQPNLAEGAHTPGSGPRPAATDLAYATGGPFLRELRVRAQAAADALNDAKRRTPATADQAWVTLDDALRRRHSDAGTQLGRAKQGFEVAERGYRAGTATFFDLDHAVQLYLTTSLQARAALRDAHVAFARLAVVVGTGAAASSSATSPESSHE